MCSSVLVVNINPRKAPTTSGASYKPSIGILDDSPPCKSFKASFFLQILHYGSGGSYGRTTEAPEQLPHTVHERFLLKKVNEQHLPKIQCVIPLNHIFTFIAKHHGRTFDRRLGVNNHFMIHLSAS